MYTRVELPRRLTGRWHDRDDTATSGLGRSGTFTHRWLTCPLTRRLGATAHETLTFDVLRRFLDDVRFVTGSERRNVEQPRGGTERGRPPIRGTPVRLLQQQFASGAVK